MLKRRCFLMLLLCMILPCFAMADHTVRASVGYDNAALAGRWYPIFVRITADGTPIDGVLETQVRVGAQEYDVLRMPVSVPAGETRQYRLSVRPHVSQRTFDVLLTTNEGTAYTASASAQRMTDGDALLVGILGGDKRFAQALSSQERRDIHGEREAIEAILLTPDAFPESDRECNAFDAMIVLDGADAALAEGQKQLMLDWQERGGIALQESSTQIDAAAALAGIEALQKDGQQVLREDSAYRYGESLNAATPIGQGNRLLPVLLAAYVLLCGVGAYLLMRRMDRSNWLWIVLPAMAVAMCAVLAAAGRILDMNRPMSSSVHVTHYEENGRAQAQELALMTYAGQQRMTVSAQDGFPLERMEYVYYHERAEDADSRTLRDVISLGEAPSLELPGGADWLRRSIVVHNPAAPQGELTASAAMEKAGLRVHIANHTDTPILNAVLLTEIGYAMLGDLMPQEEAQVLLARMEESPFDPNGNPVLRNGCMLPFSVSLYQSVLAAVDPERAEDPEFTYAQLPQQEQLRRRLFQRTLEMGAHHTQQAFSCVLVGETPQIACAPLLINGERVARSEQRSVLIREIPLEAHAQDGRYFHPQGTFARLRVHMNADGRPMPVEAYESSYVYDADEVLLGFRLTDVDPASVEEIRLYASVMEEAVSMEVYDWAKKAWTDIPAERLITLSGALLRSAVNEAGELTIRYTGGNLTDRGVYLHSIAVEGCAQPAREAEQEGGGMNDPM